MLTVILAAVGLFAATNIDDIVVLTVIFVASSRRGIPGWKIVVGQYLGFIALVTLSVVAALGLTVVPDEWVGLIGVVPLAIGIYLLIKGLRSRDDDDDDSGTQAGGLLAVAGITIANGADNISLYTPVFRSMDPADTALTIVVFMVLVAVWCVVARTVGTNRRVTELLERVEHWLVPLVFIGLGLYIIIESGVLLRLVQVLS
ncbi:cadmium resistance transporter [Naasia lichenicola]|uniref:Cadmium transporter n=1 Tax=Naasia lichenicola TaxID=2565933 RepID=A0A4S4FKP6_9MICO|nr:cadmium resistance transporter [Naasia lichenicola]THG31013.1 cadmium transporter [Naasia lichenicola]